MPKRETTASQSSVQEQPPNFHENGELYLVRCFACEPQRGRENWAPAVASGYCAWCNWPVTQDTARGGRP